MRPTVQVGTAGKAVGKATVVFHFVFEESVEDVGILTRLASMVVPDCRERPMSELVGGTDELLVSRMSANIKKMLIGCCSLKLFER